MVYDFNEILYRIHFMNKIAGGLENHIALWFIPIMYLCEILLKIENWVDRTHPRTQTHECNTHNINATLL